MNEAAALAALNQHHAVGDVVRFSPLQPGVPVIDITNDFASARIALHGAHVLSYVPRGQRDVLWLSQAARYEEGKAIRGGIPVIWPWFGAHPLDTAFGAHGYVRNHPWVVAHTAIEVDGSTTVLLRYDAERTASEVAAWPYAFVLMLEVNVGSTLTVTLRAANPGGLPVRYTCALHSYFAISDIEAVRIEGLDDVTYLDKPTGFSAHRQHGVIQFNGEVDRVYQPSAGDVVIVDEPWQRRLRIAKRHSNTTVVWNPGPEVAAGMADIPPNGYREMVCVETAHAHADVVTLAPGAQAEMATIISVE